MSVDLTVMLPSPVALAAVMTTASDTVRQLINVDRGPELNVIVGRAYDRGVRVEAGRRFRHAELEAISVGDPIPPGEAGDAGAAFFEIDVVETGDVVRLMIITHLHEAGGHVEAVLSPARTCGGVVVATGIALATALVASSQFHDDEIGMLRTPESDPHRVIAQTRLADPSPDFRTGCHQYMR